MKTLSVEELNEKFGTNLQGEEIGYSERGVNFREVECTDIEDFHENADFGQCWTDDNITYYKIRNGHGEAEAFFIDEEGEIETI